MKKFLILIVVLAILLLAVGSVSADAGVKPPNPPGTQEDLKVRGNSAAAHAGLMGRGGIVGKAGKNGGELRDALVAAFADASGIPLEEFQAKLASGMSILQVLREKGLSEEDTKAMIDLAYTDALADAVTAGLLTQEYADWLQAKHDLSWENGSLPGFNDSVDDPGDDVDDDDEDVDDDTEEDETIDTGTTATVYQFHRGPKLWKHKK